MDAALQNDTLRLLVDPPAGTWSVYNLQAGDQSVTGVHTWAACRSRGDHLRLPEVGSRPVVTTGAASSPHGLLHLLNLDYPAREQGMRVALTFAIPESHPLLLWKLEIENSSTRSIQLERVEMLYAVPPTGELHLGQSASQPVGQPAFFSNGWQSWSYAGVYGAGDRYRRTRLGPFREPTDFNAGTPQPWRRDHFASDMFGVLGDRRSRAGVLAGFLSQRQQFGSLEAHLAPLRLRLWANGDRARLDPGAVCTTDWACLSFLDVDDPDPLGAYIQAVAREHDLHQLRSTPIPTGWCSWYQFSTKDYIGAVSARDIQANLQALSAARPGLPLQVCQIDDGFEQVPGDWQTFTPGFPLGVAPLADEIHRAGFTPGIWLAPFIVDRRSNLAAAHPDWLLRGPTNLYANAGYLWNGFAAALDLTNSAALEYAADTVHTAVHAWGFDYLKLDFLYAAALPGRYRDATRTRAQVLHAGLTALRRAAGENAILLGCACPLGSAIGLVDAMRIGADTGSRWSPAFAGIESSFRREPNLPAARNALHNAISRAPLHGRWWNNDPDCLLLRPTTHLTPDEVLTAASVIALTGGSLLLSDDLTALPPERRRIAEVLLPLIGKAPRVLDWFDAAPSARLRLDLQGPAGSWSLLALINWADHPADLSLRLEDFHFHSADSRSGEFYARRFWLPQHALTVELLQANTPLILRDIPAHGAVVFAVRPALPGAPQYLGSDLHISQGLEVASWNVIQSGSDPAQSQLQIELSRPGPARGRFFLALPRPPRQAALNGSPLAWETCGQDCYAFPVEFEQTARIRITI